MLLDKTSFENLYYEYGPRLTAYALKYLSDVRLSQDSVQDVFVSLWEKYHGQERENWSFLLFKMTRNKCLNCLKHISFLRTVVNPEIDITSDEEILFCADFNGGGSIDSDLILNELSREINNAVERLPQKAREVFLKSRRDGMKNSEIAVSMGISEKAVEKSISRALRHLKKNLNGR